MTFFVRIPRKSNRLYRLEIRLKVVLKLILDMHYSQKASETFPVKRGLNASAKKYQLRSSCTFIARPFYLVTQTDVRQHKLRGSIIRCSVWYHESLRCIFFLPNDKILDWFKLEAFADNKIYVTEKLKLVFRMVENIVGKRENAVTSIFSFSHFFFKRLLVQSC